MNQSALLVLVPEAEPLVRALRLRFDPSAAVGVPAHISVLFPFMPPEQLTADVLERLRAIAGGFVEFDFTLNRTARFARTTYLVPEPDKHFAAMTAKLAREFPDYPPYGGRFPEVIPHLTVADQSELFASIAERELAGGLSQCDGVHATCRSLALYENSNNGRWRHYESFALACAAAPGQ
jgi:2'-5' RNA ligase